MSTTEAKNPIVVFVKRRFYAVFVWTVLIATMFGCGYSNTEDVAFSSTTQEKLSLYRLQLTYQNPPSQLQQYAYSPYRTWLAISYSPMEKFPSGIDIDSGIFGQKVKPTPTPWAPAWDRRSVVLKMNHILEENGIASEHIRVRMIAHAIVASGWKQNVWNFNAWGVKQGSWEKQWYVMATYEEDSNGNVVFVEDAMWRAFEGWSDAIRDFKGRISPDSQRPAYRKAHEHLMSEKVSFRSSKAYWEALGAGNYYTASKFTGEKFARLCGGVRAILQSI